METRKANVLLLAVWLAGLFRCISLVEASRFYEEWEEIFRKRQDGEWVRIWNIEKHRRCHHHLAPLVDWACKKDIYASPPGKRNMDAFEGYEDEFLPIDRANSFGMKRLRSRKNRFKRYTKQEIKISEECCLTNGCDWEEYAEYCNTTRKRF